jgi:hypothetical protein
MEVGRTTGGDMAFRANVEVLKLAPFHEFDTS